MNRCGSGLNATWCFEQRSWIFYRAKQPQLMKVSAPSCWTQPLGQEMNYSGSWVETTGHKVLGTSLKIALSKTTQPTAKLLSCLLPLSVQLDMLVSSYFDFHTALDSLLKRTVLAQWCFRHHHGVLLCFYGQKHKDM